MRWLLPEYIEDILPAEAMRIERLRRSILDLFIKNKYELVIPVAGVHGFAAHAPGMTSSCAPSRWSTSSRAG